MLTCFIASCQDDDDDWVGAWWIGFLLCAGLAFIVAIPLLLFPKQLPFKHRNENDEDKPDFASFGAQLKGEEIPVLFQQSAGLKTEVLNLVLVGNH